LLQSLLLSAFVFRGIAALASSGRIDIVATVRQICAKTHIAKTLVNWRIAYSGGHFRRARACAAEHSNSKFPAIDLLFH
jgi:hypothetical protein